MSNGCIQQLPACKAGKSNVITASTGQLNNQQYIRIHPCTHCICIYIYHFLGVNCFSQSWLSYFILIVLVKGATWTYAQLRVAYYLGKLQVC